MGRDRICVDVTTDARITIMVTRDGRGRARRSRNDNDLDEVIRDWNVGGDVDSPSTKIADGGTDGSGDVSGGIETLWKYEGCRRARAKCLQEKY